MGSQIKRSIRNLFVAYATYVLRIGKFFHKPKDAQVRVLVFHDVTDVVWFQTTLAFLHTRYHVLTPKEFVAGTYVTDKINILITFDDGYASWTEICAPILKAYNCFVLFFVNSGLLDAEPGDKQRQYCRERLLLREEHKIATWNDILFLREQGHCIGGHTTTHARLSQLYKESAMKEISEDKMRIEKMLGITLTEFAYPFGTADDFTKETEALVSETGYIRGYTTIPNLIQHAEGMQIARLCLEEGMSTRRLSYWVEGGYDVYMKIKRLCAG